MLNFIIKNRGLKSDEEKVTAGKRHSTPPTTVRAHVAEGSISKPISDMKGRCGILGRWPAPVQKKGMTMTKIEQNRNPIPSNCQQPVAQSEKYPREDTAPTDDELYINGVAVSWERLDDSSLSCRYTKMTHLERDMRARHWNTRKTKTHKFYERLVRLRNGEITRQTLTVSTSPSKQRAFREVLGDAKRLDREVSYVGVIDTRDKRRCSHCKLYKPVNGYSRSQWKKFGDLQVMCRKCYEHLLPNSFASEQQWFMSQNTYMSCYLL